VQLPFAKASVIGLGYIGLPTAAMLANRGIEVVGVDVNERIVRLLNEGKVQIVEPDLDIAVQAAVATGRLRAVTTPEPAEVFILAVPTPFTNGHTPDLSYIEAAARALAPVLEKGNLVVLESTSPVGTTEKFARWLAELRPDLSFPHHAGERADVCIAYCP
jgi:UDP-N-acetyl-D-mannosaminuronic acid dehydrogenase